MVDAGVVLTIQGSEQGCSFFIQACDSREKAMVQRISIIGCGTLGLPLGQQLAQAGFEVVGTTRSEEKLATIKAAGITPVQLEYREGVEPVGDLAALLAVDLLIVNMPPSGCDNALYQARLAHLADAAAKAGVQQVIFVSATFVYPSPNGEVVEADAAAVSGPVSDIVWLDAEKHFSEHPTLKTTVLRLSGIIGAGRPVGYYFAGRAIKGGDNPVNMIHQDDCIAVIIAVIAKQCWGEIFNVSAPVQIAARDFYSRAAELQGVDAPKFVEGDKPFRIVNSDHLQATLGYRFIHPDPLAALDRP